MLLGSFGTCFLRQTASNVHVARARGRRHMPIDCYWAGLELSFSTGRHVARTRVRQIAPSRREGGIKCEELAKLCSTRLHGEQSPSNYHWSASACNLARGPGTTFVSRLCFVDCVRQLAKKRSKQKFRKRTQSRSQTSWLPSFPIPKPPFPGIQSRTHSGGDLVASLRGGLSPGPQH